MLLLFTGCVEPQVEPKSEVQKIRKETFIWDKTSIAYISQKEYDKVMEEYIKKNYPKKVKAYKWKKKQEQINNITTIGSLMWQDNQDTKTVQRDC